MQAEVQPSNQEGAPADDVDKEIGAKDVEKVSTVLANHESSKVALGLLVTASGGFAFGFFSPLFNIGVNDHFKWLPEGTVHLTGWTANFYFAASFCFFAHVCGIARMGGSEPTNCRAYIYDNSNRSLALATGLVCGMGNTLQFLGGMAAGFATCDMVQAFPLVGILWGMVFFGEFGKAPVRVNVLLVFLYIVYIIAVGLLALSVKE